MCYEYSQLEEKRKHGSLFFPFAVYRNLLPICFETFPIHWHKEMEIALVHSGSGYYTINQQEILVKKGDMIIMPPRTLHGMHAISSRREFHIETMVFDINMLVAAVSDACTVKYFAPLLQGKCNCIYVCADMQCEEYQMKIMKAYKEKEEGYELETKANLFLLFKRLFDLKVIVPNEITHKTPIIYEAMLVAIEYISTHYKESITLDEMSEVTGKSKYYLTRNFHKFTGMPCIEYINHYRLTMAAELLRESSRLIIDIAMEVGFDNISYFNKLFRSKFEVTPKAYRKMMEENK